ncbi:stealth conserved region 3 domain-containing protein [Microbacterium sp. 1P10UB]|uniref:stealth conserved region 3 domain-containing protein n=1 Tax=unclassified Microbacterium TaxID=2609290 RepID=UPI0039A33C4F
MTIPLTALPREPRLWPVLAEREDLILAGGVLHVPHADLTPEQARTEDLLLIRDALDAAGIPVLLLRRSARVPALAVDEELRTEALAAIAELCEREPLYGKVQGHAPLPLQDLPVSEAGPSVVRVFRPRIAASGLRYGADHAVGVEFWRIGGALVEAPRENVLTRRVFARQDLDIVEVEAHGRPWRTIRGMFDAQPHEVTAEIDMVFSWVDGSSSEFLRQRAARLTEYVVGEGDDGPARFRQVDELRYALRSVHMYAPWVRRIFIATDSPAPAWLLDHPRVTVVPSDAFFADTSSLPTHNSHAVEAQLHRIEGLSEHFLYSNDDMFFARPVDPDLFFTPGGVSKFVESDVRIGPGAARIERSGHDNALRVNRALLEERFGRTITRDLEHCATPLRRSVMAELEEAFADDFRRTAASRFRAATDISVTNSLYHYYALLTGRAVSTERPRTRYVQTTLARSLTQMEKLAERRDIDMFCLNDGGETEVPETVRVRAVLDLLGRMFPVAAPWEDPAVGISAALSAAPSEERSAARH